jgi:uncharacterized protein (TIRG00374 family)
MSARVGPRARLAIALAAWGVATALVVLAFRAVGWRAALDALGRAHPGWTLLAMACHLGIVALWAWQSLLLLPRGVRVGWRRMFEVQALTTTATNTVPAFLGQATGVALLAERGGVGPAVALGVFAQHNLAEGVAKLATLLVAARVAPLPPWMRGAVAGLVAAVVGLVAALAVATWAARRRPLRAAAPVDAPRVDTLDAEPRAEPRAAHWRTRAWAFVVSWVSSLDALRSPRFLLAVVAGLLMKGAEAAGWWAVERALGVAPRPGSPVLALAATNLASAVPLTPGNLGVYEGAAFGVYHGLLGVPRETALALGVLGHVAYLVPLVGAGWVLLSVRQARALAARRRAR